MHRFGQLLRLAQPRLSFRVVVQEKGGIPLAQAVARPLRRPLRALRQLEFERRERLWELPLGQQDFGLQKPEFPVPSRTGWCAFEARLRFIRGFLVVLATK